MDPTSSPQLLLHTNRALKVVSACSRAALRASDQNVLLKDVCQLVATFYPNWIAFAAIVSGTGSRVTPIAMSGFSEAGATRLNRLLAAQGLKSDPTSLRCVIHRSLTRGQPNVLSDQPWWGRKSTQAGIFGGSRCLILPLILDGHQIGVIGLCSQDRKAFSTPEELSLFSDMADTVALGLARLKGAAKTQRDETQTRFVSIVEHGFQEVLVFDAFNLRPVYANPCACRNLGYTFEELRRLTLAEICPNLCGDDVRAMLAPLLDGDTDRIQCSALQERRDGSRYTVDVYLHRSDAGATKAVVLILIDVSAREEAQQRLRALEAQLEHAQRMEGVSRLAGGVAHDFNNVLTPLVGYIDLAMEDIPPNLRAYRDLEKARRSARRAKGLVDGLLAFSQQSQKKRHPVSLAGIVDDVLATLKSRFRGNIEIRTHAPQGLGLVLGDSGELRQVVTNLCSNAFEAMKGKGALTVLLDEVEVDATWRVKHKRLQPGSHIRLTVRDTGPGMSDTTRSRAFEPFFTKSTSPTAMGLGLTIVDSAVGRHGGDIAIQSQIGVGTVVQVLLPEHLDFSRKQRDRDDYTATHERILFVEDKAENARIVEQMLRRLGYRVEVETDSSAALRRFQRDPTAVDVLITDQFLSGMSGAQLASKMLRIRPDLPVILATGFSETMSTARSRELGIREFVMKPFVVQDLNRAIRRVLQPNLFEV